MKDLLISSCVPLIVDLKEELILVIGPPVIL